MINKLICDDHWLISQLVKLIKLWSKKSLTKSSPPLYHPKKPKTTPNIIRKMRNLTIQKNLAKDQEMKKNI
jgi:hypothetical protein